MDVPNSACRLNGRCDSPRWWRGVPGARLVILLLLAFGLFNAENSRAAQSSASYTQSQQTLAAGGQRMASPDYLGLTTLSWTGGISENSSFGITIRAGFLGQFTPPPNLASLNPADAVSGSGDLNVTLQGSDFVPSALALWNGTPLATTFVSGTTLTAAVPGSLLISDRELAVASVTVENPGAGRSAPRLFTIKSALIGPVQSSAVDPGQTSVTQVLPLAPGQAGLSASFSNNSPGSATVTTAVYTSNPVPGTTIDTGGGVVDLQISGANPADSATVNFYYSTAVAGTAEDNLVLRYYTGAAWSLLLNSGDAMPAKDTRDNLDNTISGGRFTAVFNHGSTPSITELTGTIIALSVNAAPVAHPDTATVLEDGTLEVPAPGLLANDTDSDRDPLKAILVSGPSHGQLSWQPNGAFTYTPQPNFHGTDQFTYVANDELADSDPAAVTITVTPVNDAPVAKVKNVTAPADAHCSAMVSIDDGSFDIDAGDAITLAQTPPGPYPVGVTLVTLTVTDSHGASDSRTATVTVVDDAAPVALARDLTLQLDAAGQASIIPAQINNDSTDNCGIQSLSLNITSFTCANLGPNTVTLTVTDVHGKSASATAVVTVTDVTKPTLTLNGPVEIQLRQGNTYQEQGATAVDQCDSSVPVVIGGDPVNTMVIGVYVVTYDAKDQSGNQAVRLTRTVRVTPAFPFTILNALVGFQEVDLDLRATVTGDILSQRKLTHGIQSLVTGRARNAAGPAELKQSARVSGNLEAGGAVTLNQQAAAGADVISGGNVDLRNQAQVAGNVTASGTVSRHASAAVGGTITEQAPVPQFQDVLLPELGILPTRPDIDVPKDGLRILPPGVYGKLDLKPGATLEVAAGTYFFEEIHAAQNVRFQLDVRAGSLTINVFGNVETGPDVRFVPLTAPGEVAALKVLLQTQGARVNLGRQTEFMGTILAPEAVLDLGQQVNIQGALYGRRVLLGANASVVAAPASAVLTSASVHWLGYRNSCEGAVSVLGSMPHLLMRLLGQTVYGCQSVDLGSGALIAGNAASQQAVRLSGSSLVLGSVTAVQGPVDLGSAAEVIGSAQAGGRVDLANQAKVGGNVASGSNVDLKQQSQVSGNIRAAGQVQVHKSATVGGVLTEKAVVVPPTEFYLPVLGLSAPGAAIEILQHGELTLPPGTYGELTMRQNATVRLAAGNYHFDVMDLGQKTRLDLDLRAGPIVINVAETLDMDQQAEMHAVAPAGVNAARRVLFQVQGKRVKLGQHGSFLGTFMAPRADIELRQDSKLQGALFGDTIRLGSKAEVQVEAALDLMLQAALGWQAPAAGQAGPQERVADNGKLSKQIVLPHPVEWRAPLLEITADRGGSPVLRVTSPPGFKGELQSSDRLAGPWAMLAELDGAEGVLEFTDDSAIRAGVRFYRLISDSPNARK